MKSIVLKILMAVAMVLALAFPVQAENGGKKMAKSGVNKAFGKVRLPSPFGRHPNIAPIKIGDKDVYVLELFGDDGRASNNFSVDGQKNFKLYVMNVSPADRLRMKFQRKGDKQWNEDSNRGPQLYHSKTVDWTMEGGNNYLAARGFSANQVLAKNPDAVVLLVQDGLSIDEVLAAFAD